MTPEQERKANEAANKIIDELTNAVTEADCEAIGARSGKLFARLQEVHPVRATHIMNLASLRKRDFARGRLVSEKVQGDLWA